MTTDYDAEKSICTFVALITFGGGFCGFPQRETLCVFV